MRTRFARPIALACLAFAVHGCAARRGSVGRFFHYAPYRFSGPAPKVECRRSGSWRWCVDRPPEAARMDPEKVLYVLHHAGGSEKTWSEYPVARAFYARLAERGIAAPRVVAVSYGKYWTLMETGGEKQPPLLLSFLKTVMPEIERSLDPPPSKRLLWGTSQGGLNGASLILKDPRRFSRAVLSCPAIFSFPIFSDTAADAYTKRVSADRDSVYWGLKRLRPLVGGGGAWEREGPLAVIINADRLPPTLLQVNGGDEYGFHDGGRRFAALAKERGLPVEIETNGSSHCVVDAENAIDFLME